MKTKKKRVAKKKAPTKKKVTKKAAPKAAPKAASKAPAEGNQGATVTIPGLTKSAGITAKVSRSRMNWVLDRMLVLEEDQAVLVFPIEDQSIEHLRVRLIEMLSSYAPLPPAGKRWTTQTTEGVPEGGTEKQKCLAVFQVLNTSQRRASKYSFGGTYPHGATNPVEAVKERDARRKAAAK